MALGVGVRPGRVRWGVLMGKMDGDGCKALHGWSRGKLGALVGVTECWISTRTFQILQEMKHVKLSMLPGLSTVLKQQVNI